MIEELGRREDFYLHLAGGSSRRTAGAVFHNAHLPNKLSCANGAEKDGVAIEFPEYVDGTAEEAKNTVCRVSLSEEDLPCGEVRASHCASQSPIAGAPTRAILSGIYHLRNPRCRSSLCPSRLVATAAENRLKLQRRQQPAQ